MTTRLSPKKILIIEDDPDFADLLARAVRPHPTEIHTNALTAIQALDPPPALILLDVLLTGPSGFTLLNELASYSDTAKIPVIIVSSLDFSDQSLAPYNVVAILSKDTLTPATLRKTVKNCLKSDFLTQSEPKNAQ